MSLLNIQDLQVAFHTEEGNITAVNKLNFALQQGETLGIVGESGSGKSQTAFAIMGLLAKNGRAQGSVRFDGREILNLSEGRLNRIRAREIAMIFQDPMTSLNPYMKVGAQLAEVLVQHQGMSKATARAEALRMLEAVKIPEAQKRMDMYPHECSGGMRQRVMIAMALLCRPKLLIADEPTTALDVTVQAQIMALLNELKRDFGTTIMLITHDLGVVAGICDHVLVMYAGQTMEYGSVAQIFYRPTTPTPSACWAPCRASTMKPPNCPPSQATRPIWPRCRRAARFRRVVKKCRKSAGAKCRRWPHWPTAAAAPAIGMRKERTHETRSFAGCKRFACAVCRARRRQPAMA